MTEWTEKCNKKNIMPKKVVYLKDRDDDRVREMRQTSIKRLLGKSADAYKK